MVNFLLFLSKHPLLGLFTSFAAVYIQELEAVSNVIKIVGGCIGIIVGFLTVISKTIEVKNKLKYRKNDKDI